MCVTGANAADYSVSDASKMDWTGFYAGIFGSYGAGTVTGVTLGTSDASSVKGAGIGAALGYDYDMNGVIIGGEADLQYTTMSDSAPCTLSPTQTCASRVNWMGSVRGRVGVALDTLLVYGTAGLALADITTTVSPPTGGTTGSYQSTYFGWVAGAGAELAITDSLTGKLEYNYSSYGSQNTTAGSFVSIATITPSPIHTIKFGLNYRFN